MREASLTISGEGRGRSPREAAEEIVARWLGERLGEGWRGKYGFEVRNDEADCVEGPEGPECLYGFDLTIYEAGGGREVIGFACTAGLFCRDYENLKDCAVTNPECLTEVEEPGDSRVELFGLRIKA